MTSPTKKPTATPSRIPVPLSPPSSTATAPNTSSEGLFRRSWSLRIKGDKSAPLLLKNSDKWTNLYPRCNNCINTSDTIGQKSKQQSTQPLGNSPLGDAPAAGRHSIDANSGISSGGGGGSGGDGETNVFTKRGCWQNSGTTPSQLHRRNGGPKGSITPNGPSAPYCNSIGSSSNGSRTRSLSLSLSNTTSAQLSLPPSCSVASSPRTPPSSPSEEYPPSSKFCHGGGRTRDWEAESVTSGISMASSICDHASVAHNGTTFSGRRMKYVYHCSQHSGREGDDYLTPTQRAQRQVRKLKTLLQQAQRDLESKDSDIIKLTKEVVELRLYKAALSSPEERSNSSSDAVTVRENQAEEEFVATPDANLTSDMTSSYTDSGHYDDYTTSSIHSKDSILEDFSQSPYKKPRSRDTVDKSIAVNLLVRDLECEHQELMAEYEKRIQNLVRAHESDSLEQRQKNNDKIEELLCRIAEINKKYWELVPDLENAREKIKELEGQLEDALKKLDEQEERHKKVYLQLYAQGKQAVLNEQENHVDEVPHHVPSRISVSELLHQLQITQTELENIRDINYSQQSSSNNSLQPLLSAKEAVTLWVLGARKAMYKQVMEAKHKKIDPEITLQFLKSAIYYFLTDKENSQGHLRAIQSILGFSPSEISNIEKARAFS